MLSWLTALRIARREARRATGRSALVVALIGLPVVALTFVAVTYDSFRLTTGQELEREMGAADAVVSWPLNAPLAQSPDGSAWNPLGEDEPARAQPPTAAQWREVLPPGARTVPLHEGRLEVRTAAGIAEIATEWLDLTDPVHAGRVELRDGRAPSRDGEVAVTRQAAQRLGVELGDEVRSADGSDAWTVVGFAEHPHRFREALLLPAASAVTGEEWAEWLVTGHPVTWDDVRELNQHGIRARSREVVLKPPPSSEVDPGFTAAPERDDTAVVAGGSLIAGLALLEVVLLAGPAFAVGARRRQRDLALVAASGGNPAHLRRIVLADGVVLGLAGAVAGVALGVAVTLGALPLLEEHLMNRRIGGVRVFPLALLAVAGLAVLTGLAAALVPAATAARQHVVTALAGRRGVVRSRRRWLVLGLVTAAAGAGLAAAGAWRVDTGTVLAGLIVGQLGLVLCTPALVGLVARLGRFLPLAPRIALRDTARNRAAAAPAISAVMAAVTGALALGIYLTAAEQRSQATYQSGLPVGHAAVPYEVWGDGGPHVLTAGERERVRDALESTLPVDRVHQIDRPACPPADDAEHCWLEVPVAEPHRCPAEALSTERVQALFESGATAVSGDSLLTAEEQRAARNDPRCQEPWRGWSVHLGTALVDDGAAIPALIGGEQADLASARQTLARGGVVVTDARTVVDGQATLEISRHDGEREQTREVTVDAFVLDSGENVPFAVVSPRLLDRLGLASEPYGLVVATTQATTQPQEEALRAALSEIQPELRHQVQVERGGFGSEDPFLLVLAAVAAVVALAAAGIATGLAAADRRGDLATLGAVGATPRVRRLLSVSQAGVIAGLGAGLGAIAGLGSATAVLVALNRAEAHVWPVAAPPYQLVLPWATMALLLVAAPAVAMLGAGLLTRSRLPIERRT